MSLIDQLKQQYAGKKVFVTGHTGFKGSWLLCMLRELGAVVKGYALAAGDTELYTLLTKDAALCESVIADIMDKERLVKELVSFEPDFVFHLAAQPLVRRSYEIPSETFAVNAVGTAHLLDAVRASSKSCAVVIVTTDKVYENVESMHAYVETDRLGGYDPYSASKACAEIVVHAYRQSFFNSDTATGIASARAGNVIGGGDRAKDRIIPDVVNALEQRQPVVIRNPLSVRPWQHVLEPLTGYLQLGAKLFEEPVAFSESFNFGPATDDNLPVEEVVKTAIAAWGEGEYRIASQVDAVHEAGLLRLNVTKIARRLGAVPLLPAKDAIGWTIEWYRRSHQEPPMAITVEQVHKYWSLSR